MTMAVAVFIVLGEQRNITSLLLVNDKAKAMVEKFLRRAGNSKWPLSDLGPE
jgi:hypothetical protein